MEVKKIERISLWKDGFLVIECEGRKKGIGAYNYSNELKRFILDYWTEAHRLQPESDKDISVYIVVTSFVESKAKFFAVIRERFSYWGYDSRWHGIEEKVKTIIPQPDRQEYMPKKVATATLNHERLYPDDAWKTVVVDVYMVSPKVKRIYVQYEEIENDRVVKENEIELKLSS